MIMCTLLKRGPKSEDVTNVQFTFGKQPWVSSGHAIQSSRETQYSKRQGRLDMKKSVNFLLSGGMEQEFLLFLFPTLIDVILYRDKNIFY